MDEAAAEIRIESPPSMAATSPSLDPRDAVIRLLRAGSAAEALDALRESPAFDLPPTLIWVAPDGATRAASPRGSQPPPPPRPPLAGGERRALTGDGPEGALAIGLPAELGSLMIVGGVAEDAEDALDTLGELVAAFAQVARRALESDVLETELATLRRRSEESEALLTLGLAAHRSLDPDEVLGLVARFARTLLGANYVTVHIVEQQRVVTAASTGLRTVPDPGARDPFAARVVAERKPLTASDVPGCCDHPGSLHREEGMRTALGVPLSLFGETFGALVIGYRREHPLSPRDTRLALTLAGHAAVAINNAQLHRTIADRSRELEQAYADLRRSSDEKERFFASMSHELRTPLNAIIGYHSLLLDEIRAPLSEAQRPFLENAQRATKTLLTLVNDVLDLSKIEAGKIELDLCPVRLVAALEEVMATIRPLADSKSIAVSIEMDGDDDPTLITDPDRLRQILLNLLSNAVKFTDRGVVRVSVRGGDETRPLAIRVTDTGPGIPTEHQERIFQEFEQITGPGSRGGTGLGLAIARKLARRMGGDLSLESSAGTGSTFILRLPVSASLGGTSIAPANESV